MVVVLCISLCVLGVGGELWVGAFMHGMLMFNFVLIFVIASGKPPAPISKDLGFILKSILGLCWLFFRRCCKTEKIHFFCSEILGLGGAGGFCIFFASFLNVFYFGV